MTFHISRSEMMMYGSVVGQGQVSLTLYNLYYQKKFSTDFIFVLILVRMRNDFFKVINKYGPGILKFMIFRVC